MDKGAQRGATRVNCDDCKICKKANVPHKFEPGANPRDGECYKKFSKVIRCGRRKDHEVHTR